MASTTNSCTQPKIQKLKLVEISQLRKNEIKKAKALSCLGTPQPRNLTNPYKTMTVKT